MNSYALNVAKTIASLHDRQDDPMEHPFSLDSIRLTSLGCEFPDGN